MTSRRNYDLYKLFGEYYPGSIYANYTGYLANYKTKICTKDGCSIKECCYFAHSKSELNEPICIQNLEKRCYSKSCELKHTESLPELPKHLEYRIKKFMKIVEQIDIKEDKNEKCKRKIDTLYDDVEYYNNKLKRQRQNFEEIESQLHSTTQSQLQTQQTIQSVVDELNQKHVQEVQNLHAEYAKQLSSVSPLLSSLMEKYTIDMKKATQNVQNITTQCMDLHLKLQQKEEEIKMLKEKLYKPVDPRLKLNLN